MSSRMDRYKGEVHIPKRSDKNKPLYTTIYNAYDEFENLIVPDNSKEIDLATLKKEVTSRKEYRESKSYDSIVSRKEKEIEKKETSKEKVKAIYDINELLDKAKKDKKEDTSLKPMMTHEDYLKKLNMGDIKRTKFEEEKELFAELTEENEEENSLMKTSTLSLEILSDLKSDDDNTMIDAPIKDEMLPEEAKRPFFSGEYEFSKKDFEDKNYSDEKVTEDDEDNSIELMEATKEIKEKVDNNVNDKEDDDDDFFDEKDNSSIGFKIVLLIIGLAIVVAIVFYLLNYFNKV